MTKYILHDTTYQYNNGRKNVYASRDIINITYGMEGYKTAN